MDDLGCNRGLACWVGSFFNAEEAEITEVCRVLLFIIWGMYGKGAKIE